jgi:hypothetical protein
VFSKFCELRVQLVILFTSEESELADLLSDETSCNKVAYLADVSQLLTGVCRERMKIFVLVVTKVTLQGKLTLWGERN